MAVAMAPAMPPTITPSFICTGVGDFWMYRNEAKPPPAKPHKQQPRLTIGMLNRMHATAPPMTAGTILLLLPEAIAPKLCGLNPPCCCAGGGDQDGAGGAGGCAHDGAGGGADGCCSQDCARGCSQDCAGGCCPYDGGGSLPS